MKGKIIWMGTLLILLSVTATHASVPPLMNYQGKLTDETGVPVSDGDYTVQFRIYTAPSGGDLLWDEEQTVTVEDGLFSVLLGDVVDPIPDTVFTGPTRYLALQVSPDPEMSTRKPIVSVGYAFRSLHSDTAEYALSGAGGGSNWTVTDSVLHTNSYWGIARGGTGNALHGDSAHTHINFGIACTTGTSGQNRTYPTVSGGYGNTASGWSATVGGGNNNVCSRRYATVSGGSNNTVSGADAGSGTVGGGDNNTVSGVDAGCGTVGGGSYNTVSDDYATVSGGYLNEANSFCATVCGGMDNTASSSYSVVGGGQFNAVTEYAFRATIGGGQYDTTKAVYGGAFSGYSNLAGDASSDTAAFVGGGYDNSAIHKYATVGGGKENTASGNYATVAGGWNNTADGGRSFVGGGYGNIADGSYATVAGGVNHTLTESYTTVGGGYQNTVSAYVGTVAGGEENTASGEGASTVAGGSYNSASQVWTTVGGGRSDTAGAVYSGVFSGYSNLAGDASSDTAAFVGGGYDNSATAKYATVGGGIGNYANGDYATVGGGTSNNATGTSSTVSGGAGNDASASYATVGGGLSNDADNLYTTVSGGYDNDATGSVATVGGGYENRVGGDYSFAVGYRVTVDTDADLTFAFGRDFTTSTPNAVIFETEQGSNYMRLGINKTDPTYAIHLPNVAGNEGRGMSNSWDEYSSIRWKDNVTPIDRALDKIVALRGVYFDWKESGEHDVGLIAEEVGQIIPEVVEYADNGEDAEGLNYGRLVAVLVEAMKELESKNELQSEEIGLLRVEIEALKSK